MSQSSLCLNKRQEELLQLKASIINQKKLYVNCKNKLHIFPNQAE